MIPATPSCHEGSSHATSCTKENTANLLSVQKKNAPWEEQMGYKIFRLYHKEKELHVFAVNMRNIKEMHGKKGAVSFSVSPHGGSVAH